MTPWYTSRQTVARVVVRERAFPSCPYVVCALACLVSACAAGPARAAFFSEIGTDDDAAAGQYVEWIGEPRTGTYELAVFYALPGLEPRLFALFEVSVDSPTRTQMVIIHEHTIELATSTVGLEVNDVRVCGSNGGARRFVLFDQPTGWRPTTHVPDYARWADDPNVPDVHDAVTLVINPDFGWTADSPLDEPVVELGVGQVVWRPHDDDAPNGEYLALDIDDPRINPGLANAADAPEPAAGALFALGAAVLCRRRRTRRVRA